MLEKLPDLNNVKSEQKRSNVNNIGLQKVNLTTKTSTRKTEGVIKRNSTSGNTKNKPKDNLRKNMKSRTKKNVIDTSDFILHKAVAFDFHDNEFSSRFESELTDADVPDVALLESRYLVGYVCERLTKKEKNSAVSKL